jgi:hypothetical protein
MRPLIRIGASVLCLTALAAAADQAELRRLYGESRAAHSRKDFAAFLAASERLAELAPYSATARYNLACAHALTGHAADALRLLGGLVDAGASFDVAKDEDFAPIRDRKGFRDIERRMAALERPVGSSVPAFTLPERDLITEGVTHDRDSGAFFVSSVRKRKVVRVTRDRQERDFLSSGQDGLYSVVGLAVDPQRHRLWLSSTAFP